MFTLFYELSEELLYIFSFCSMSQLVYRSLDGLYCRSFSGTRAVIWKPSDLSLQRKTLHSANKRKGLNPEISCQIMCDKYFLL